MNCDRTVPAVLAAVLAQQAFAQISLVEQERSVQTTASLSSGTEASDFDEATNFGPFLRNISSSVLGGHGARAEATATQNSGLSSSLLFGDLRVSGTASTDATFDVGTSDAQSSMLVFFDLAAATSVVFTASGAVQTVGSNPNGEPSDLYGMSRVRLLDAESLDQIAGFQFQSDAGTDSASFSGTLAAGHYVILASAHFYAFSADLLGPPPRSGSGDAGASFSLSVVPAPGAMSLFGLGVMSLARRRTRR